jgi:hypothetical protein
MNMLKNTTGENENRPVGIIETRAYLDHYLEFMKKNNYQKNYSQLTLP